MLNYVIITFGCQMNLSDSEKIKNLLNSSGLTEIEDKNIADIVIINTCSIREAAENRVFGLVENLYDLKKERNNKPFVVVTGCMPGRDHKKEIRKKFKDKIDLFIKINDILELPKLIDQFFANTDEYNVDSESAVNNNNESNEGGDKKRKRERIKFNPNDDIRNIEYLNVSSENKSTFKASLPIISGCNNFCSYCVVPFTRGREKSRDPLSILSELRDLKEKNFKEVTLLGQNVNSYNPEIEDSKWISNDNPYKHKFAQLLWEINKIGIPRIYFTSSHPKDISDEVIDALRLENMGNYLHLAVQSGDNEVLKSMNRHYTVEDYLKIIEKVRKIRPEIAIGTDIIVGFPGESEEAFENTVELYKKADFDISYTSIYSDRTGTVSIKMDNKVSFDTKKERWNVLHDLMEDIVLKKNQKYLDKLVSALVEEYDEKNKYYIGHTSETKVAKFKSDKNLIGQIVNMKVDKVEEWNLYGHLE